MSRSDLGERITQSGPVLVLRTSGTTSKPKVVPLSLRSLHAGASSIGQSLGLKEADVCLNVMPYSHIGGISCNLLATLFAGGAVICAPSFNVDLFVDWLGEFKPTWYYAVPTIHKAVLLHCGTNAPSHNLRLVRSGAASLPHADAQALTELFGCSVIPSYSMSECMPIAQCVSSYNLDRPGTVGVPIASSVCIAGEDGRPLPYGEDGEICIGGPVVTTGYLNNDEANAACFFGEVDADGFRWFWTGDVGRLDEAGLLYLSGRSKELIKRGGEQVSPYEVEELLSKHPAVDVALVFGVPNDFWGEEVAACVVSAGAGAGGVSAVPPVAVGAQNDAGLVGPPVQVAGGLPAELKAYLSGQHLAASKIPRQLVIVPSTDGIPKTATGKYMRSGLAKHFNLTAVDQEAAACLQKREGGTSRVFGEGQADGVVHPDKSLLGLRFFLAFWVIFIHVGSDFPHVVAVSRNSSLSMMLFFVIDGFQLSASVTRPIADKREFYINRIVAAHPLYMLAVVFATPLQFVSVGPFVAKDPVMVVVEFLCAFFYQGAWPWGAGMTFQSCYIPLRFSSAYIFCILLFPFMQRALHDRAFFKCCCAGQDPTERCWKPMPCTWYCCWPATGCFGIILGINFLFWIVGFIMIGFLGEDALMTIWLVFYAFPPVWAAIFFLGCITWHLFEMNGRHPQGRSPHWGKLADGYTILIILVHLVLVPLSGKGVAEAIGAALSRPLRFSLAGVLLWVYALATGQGFVARLLRNESLVKYLSPASYAMYLFRMPLALYLIIIAPGSYVDGVEAPMAFGRWWLWFVVAPLTVVASMVAQHVLNGPLTAYFLRVLESCPCCGSRRAAIGEDESTLSRIVAAIYGLSGADVDGGSLLTDCGLDSFGSAALLGVLKARIPDLRLTAVEIYRIRTVGELAQRIDEGMGRTRLLAGGQASMPAAKPTPMGRTRLAVKHRGAGSEDQEDP